MVSLMLLFTVENNIGAIIDRIYLRTVGVVKSDIIPGSSPGVVGSTPTPYNLIVYIVFCGDVANNDPFALICYFV